MRDQKVLVRLLLTTSSFLCFNMAVPIKDGRYKHQDGHQEVDTAAPTNLFSYLTSRTKDRVLLDDQIEKKVIINVNNLFHSEYLQDDITDNSKTSENIDNDSINVFQKQAEATQLPIIKRIKRFVDLLLSPAEDSSSGCKSGDCSQSEVETVSHTVEQSPIECEILGCAPIENTADETEEEYVANHPEGYHFYVDYADGSVFPIKPPSAISDEEHVESTTSHVVKDKQVYATASPIGAPPVYVNVNIADA